VPWCLRGSYSIPVHDLWLQLAHQGGVSLSEKQDELFSHYIDLLLDANQRMNLTRIDTREQAEILHVGDALTLLPNIPAGQLQLADIGSGGGIPGIPLAIVRPDVSVTLFESTQKKAAFLSQTCRQLRVSNVNVIAKRAEDLARRDSLSPDYRGEGAMRESFDIVTARALAAMNVLVEWCLPLVKVGGKLLAMKGAKVHDELPAAMRAIKLLGGDTPRIHPANLPGADYHVIVEVTKITQTDPRYPRPTKIIHEKPL
jgi:16S rRNA (guanine527-N7)-methyltransferase